MPTFVVQVQDSTGKAFKEKIDAMTPEQARNILQNKYPTIGKIQKAGFDIDLSQLEAMLTSISVKDKAVFSRQFAAMVNAGVAIVRCLGVLSEQCGNPKLKKALLAISADVQQGSSLSDAMRKHPDCFDTLYVSMIEAGETGGVLDQVLDRLAKVLEDIARLKNQVKSAMTYPVAVGILAIIVFFAMTVFLIPIFAGIFDSLGVELPALTKFMLACSDFMRSWKIILPFFGAFGLVFLIKQYYKTPAGKLQIDSMLLKAPIIGDLNEKNAVARFCRIFGTLTRSGVPILNSLDIVRDIAGNQVIANAIENAKQDIQQGGMMSLAIQRENV
ncbi:MAG: type II secretion system F family protein, partial [Chroococcales cyanobacterium]